MYLKLKSNYRMEFCFRCIGGNFSVKTMFSLEHGKKFYWLLTVFLNAVFFWKKWKKLLKLLILLFQKDKMNG